MAYEGSACHASKNCAVIEFSRGVEMVDTITHEIAHMLGIVHDASKDPSHPCYERRMTIMARDFGKSRKGWSSCRYYMNIFRKMPDYLHLLDFIHGISGVRIITNL